MIIAVAITVIMNGGAVVAKVRGRVISIAISLLRVTIELEVKILIS